MGRLAEGQRRLLEALMGPEAMGIAQVELKLTDPKVCKNYCCGTCPHDLFANTRMDLGICPHSHQVKLKAEYETEFKIAASRRPEREAHYPLQELLGIRNEYERNLMVFVDDCDRRIKAAQRRLEKTPEENNKTTNLMREIGEIQSAYDTTMAEVETLGSNGKVEESMEELAKAEALKTEKQDKERELQNLIETSGASGHQKLRVCDICGAYLSILDSDRRLADHFGGKMHLGFLELRTMVSKWQERGPQSQPGRATPEGVRYEVEEAARQQHHQQQQQQQQADGATAAAPTAADTDMAPPPAPGAVNGGEQKRREPEEGLNGDRDEKRRRVD